MDKTLFPLIVLALIAIIVVLVITLLRKPTGTAAPSPEMLTKLEVLSQSQAQIDRAVREEFARSRLEASSTGQSLRSETLRGLSAVQSNISQSIGAAFQGLQRGLDERHTGLQVMQRDSARQLREETQASFKAFEERIARGLVQMAERERNDAVALRTTVDGRLEQMRHTVDEKLQGTLEARLGASFKQVSERLEQLHRGLGEVQTLAAGVGDLKRVFTNVKTRGIWGEVQLGAILEQMLAPAQYSQNVATTGTQERVEFAIRLPRYQGSDEPVWLPIDAKFPIEDYQRLVDAAEKGDAVAADRASRQMEITLKNCAKDISQKYIAPPATTDFGILFLSTESLYAEAMRRPGLAESIQREYKVALTGPSTLAALLNALQVGFRTLEIQESSSKAWDTLSLVKSEFEKYAEVLAKVKKKLTEAQGVISKAETQTRRIQRSLRDVSGAPLLNGSGGELPPPEEVVAQEVGD